jgi:hypothetical protein
MEDKSAHGSDLHLDCSLGNVQDADSIAIVLRVMHTNFGMELVHYQLAANRITHI